MTKYTTKYIAKNETSFSFDSMEDFKNWSNKIYKEYSGYKNAEITFDGNIGYDYEDSVGEVDIYITYQSEVKEEEVEIERQKSIDIITINEVVPIFMEKHNIENTMGTVVFFEWLKKDILKVSYSAFEEFRDIYFNNNPFKFDEDHIIFEDD